jgi:hypothetical protein
VVADPRGTAAPKSATGWPASSRNGGRHQIGMVADIVSEQVAGMRRNPQLSGIISIGDVVKHRLSELEAEERLMHDYTATDYSVGRS